MAISCIWTTPVLPGLPGLTWEQEEEAEAIDRVAEASKGVVEVVDMEGAGAEVEGVAEVGMGEVVVAVDMEEVAGVAGMVAVGEVVAIQVEEGMVRMAVDTKLSLDFDSALVYVSYLRPACLPHPHCTHHSLTKCVLTL